MRWALAFPGRVGARRTLAVLLLAAGGWSLAYFALEHTLADARGVVVSALARGGAPGRGAPGRRLPDFDLLYLRGENSGALGRQALHWSGYWWIPRAGRFDLVLKSSAATVVTLDSHAVLRREAGTPRGRVRCSLELARGLHHVQVEYRPAAAAAAGDGDGAGDGTQHTLRLRWSRPGEKARPFADAHLFPTAPTPGKLRLHRVARLLGRSLLVVWSLPVMLVAGVLLGLRRGWPLPAGWPPTKSQLTGLRHATRGLAYAAPVLVVAYAGALRFEAVVGRFWPDAPIGVHTSATEIQKWHPHTIHYEAEPGFTGDPFAYLHYARRMEHFYDAHVREPLFVFSTKAFLGVVDQHDVGVGLASAFFSTLAVLATYGLGACAFNRNVGLASATLMAIEADVIRLSAEGWRDDAFTFFVALTAYACVRFARRPDFVAGLILGLAGGGACLTRITSLSFLLPAYAWLAAAGCGPRGARFKHLGLGLLLTLVLLAPFLVSCAIAFGDPLHSINDHTRFFRARQALDHQASMSWVHYLQGTLRPFELFDNLAVGLTTYPFLNKWHGFDLWWAGLGSFLSAATLVGLFLFVAVARGRLLLVILMASLVPYAFTWPVSGGHEWRFTMHAYPFYLVAACLALFQAPRVLDPLRWHAWGTWLHTHPSRALGGAAAGLVVAGLVELGVHGLYYLRVSEALAVGQTVSINAGPRDAFFFADRGWYAPVRSGGISVRFARGLEASLALPLSAGRDYGLTLRLDPLAFDSASPQNVTVSLNGTRLSRLELHWEPRRIGSYLVELPGRLVRQGSNELTLRASYSTPSAHANDGLQGLLPGREGTFLLWYARLGPPQVPVPVAPPREQAVLQ